MNNFNLEVNVGEKIAIIGESGVGKSSLLNIKSILKKKPLECSGGEKARAVFARGIIMKPKIILADELTASLDMENRERIINLLFKMNKEFNTTIITVTHDLKMANRYDRVIHLERRK